jgi:hypothetical protein
MRNWNDKSPPQLPRRAMCGGMVGLFFAASMPTRAQSLLDPSLVANPSKLQAQPSAFVANSPGPSYARGMANSIVSALDSLVGAYANISGRKSALDRELANLNRSLADKISNKEKDLDEYRQGLFCSGCGQTRSQILAKGEQFPHSGQRIIAPTPGQIAAREKMLDDAINLVRQQIKKTEVERGPLPAKLSRIQTEIIEGGRLWHTAVSYEEALINQRAGDDERLYQAQRSEITKAIKRIESVVPATAALFEQTKLVQDLTLNGTLITTLVERRRIGTRSSQLQVDRAQQNARDDGGRFASIVATAVAQIKDRADSGFLSIQSNMLTPNPLNWVTGVGLSNGGILFHMGDYSDASFGTILPEVQRLVNLASLPFRHAPGPYYPDFESEMKGIGDLIEKIRQLPLPPATEPAPTNSL